MEKIKTIRNKIYNSILETIGNTPLIKVPRISKKYNCFGKLICKLEFFNPLSSVKDRIGLAMVERGEKMGLIKHETITKCLTNKPQIILPDFPPEQIEGLKRCFPLYVKFPKSRWKDIEDIS